MPATLQKKSTTRMAGEAPSRKSRSYELEARAASKVTASGWTESTGVSSTRGRQWKEMEGLTAVTSARKGPAVEGDGGLDDDDGDGEAVSGQDFAELGHGDEVAQAGRRV